ncbi:MAG: NAD-dependent epimerase/dehydratase family protein [Candidatus Buchananbacteria bacterium]
MLNKKRVVITGGAGFIGRNFIEGLKSQGIYEIISLDLFDLKDGEVTSVVGRYGDKDLLRKTLQKGDIVYHLACSTVPAVSEKDVFKDLNENIIDTINLLDICLESEIELFVFASSGGTVYGEVAEIPIREESEANPINFHGIMKLMIEKYVKLYGLRHNFNYIIMRPSNLFGRIPEASRIQGAVDIFIKKALANELIEIWGNGEVIRDYIYIDDMVDLMIKIIDSDIKNTTINIGSGTGHSLNTIIKKIKEKLELEIEVKYMPARGFDIACNILDIAKAQNLYNWHPKVNLEMGIEKTIEKIKNSKI